MSRLFAAVLAAVVLSAACGRTTPSGAPSAAAPATEARTFDVVIANGRVVDGTGAPWFRADVGITGDRITAIGNLSSARATTRIDAAGQVVAPGFIDLLGQSEFNVLVDSRAASKITQGITTEITGEGVSIAPVDDKMMADRKASYEFFKIAQDWRTLDEYFARLTKSTTAINVGTFVGSGGLRDYVVGKEDRVATADELARMKTLVSEAMAQGALGLSSSLQYIPNRFSTTDELVELAKVAAGHGGIYITHQRSEGNKVFESIDEVLAIAERADIPTEIWHLKTAYKANWGKMTEILRRIEAARARGLRVSANIYPYDRASNGLDACLPVWVREGGTDADAEASAGSGDPCACEAGHGRSERAVREPVVRIGRRGRRHAQFGAGPRRCASTRGCRLTRSARRWARTRVMPSSIWSSPTRRSRRSSSRSCGRAT